MGKMVRGWMGRGWRRSLLSFGAALILAVGGSGLLPLLPKAAAMVPAEVAQATGPKQELGDQAEPRPALPRPNLLRPSIPVVIPVDIQSHWAKDCITELVEQRLITPDARGLFYPDDPILWGDYVTLLNLLSPVGPAQGWANPLERALGVQIAPTVAAHYPDAYFQRDRPLVRAEGIMALATKLGGSYQIAANTIINASLEDGRQVPIYAREGVAAALAQGVVVNYPQANRLNSTQRLTRGEAVALLCNAAPNNPVLRQTINPAWVPQAQTPAVAAPTRELRGVWLTNVDSQVLFSTEALQAAVNRLADLNFNTIYPVVWNYGHTLYPSATARRELGVSQHLYGDLRAPRPASESDRDMMREAIAMGHARGMAVVPWFEFGFMAPANYELYRRHPDWFTQKRVEPRPLEPEPLAPRDSMRPGDVPKLTAGLDAKHTAKLTPVLDVPKVGDLAREKHRADQWLAQDDFLPDPDVVSDPGIWMEGNVIPRRWMNPFHPQVQKFQLELINELVSNYEVDGFQFDDHLGLPVDFGYDPFTINLYRSEHNGQAPPNDPQNAEWMAWRANKISDFLAEVHKLVKARRPNAVVSISPNPYPFAFTNYLQDWPTWVNRGIVDELVIQVYRSDQNRFMWEMNKPSIQAARRKIPVNIGILSGLRAAPVKMDFITDQMAAVRDRAYSGISFFFYESLWISPPPETAEQRVGKLQQAFATPAIRPGR
ncbi:MULTISPECIES: family 10 glycosylhydrolase [Cyanophyceae]|uniref:glycoside hydrolase family 10 protein n=1 Tax=Cyanophyceae TaxID=3028117 RepID=UPI0016862531|nr:MULTISPECIES: family 10 glycosylhydrolase [Cyanophyceae]MBD1918597.1 family 10 glycosylhydrolase [Phormidium sp. FACHB-77]MBD2031268.1 family 10 glycosylhydrolase [Phormidium sp. FACHB-322]MBD2052335.1 family 10 glycosylhydrolase [Leptolyngbya sp. FACHB-60]